jgi:hypothetical protein
VTHCPGCSAELAQAGVWVEPPQTARDKALSHALHVAAAIGAAALAYWISS